MTSSLIGLAALVVAGMLWTVAFVLIRRDDEGGRVTPAARRAPSPRSASPSALLAVPLLLDGGPVDRLAARAGGARRASTGALARCGGSSSGSRAARPAARARHPALAAGGDRRTSSTSPGGPAG